MDKKNDFTINELEEQLFQIDGIDDFEDGIDSLEAINLSYKIEKKLGVEVKVENFIENKVSSIAKSIVENNKSNYKSSIIVLQDKGEKSNLFLVHPVGGNAYCYKELSKRLKNEIPLYAFKMNSENKEKSVEEIAKQYIKEMKEIQKDGPYYIGGWSFGGIVSFEMARQLVNSGEEVKKLIIIESALMNNSKVVKDEDIFIGFFSTLSFLYKRDIKISKDEFKGMNVEEMKEHFVDILKREKIFKEEYSEFFTDSFFNLYKANTKSGNAYMPNGKYTGDTLIVKCKNLEENFVENYPRMKEEFLGWDDFLEKEAEVKYCSGNHWNLVYEPYVSSLANILKEEVE